MVNLADGTVFVATLVIPVVRYRLWDIDAVIRRSAGYAVVTIVLALAYLAIAAIGAVIASVWAGVVVAAFVVAMAYGPARAASQRAVDRMFYGQRNDPYRALSEVNRRLAAVAEPGTVLRVDKSFVKERGVDPFEVEGRKDGKPFDFSVGPRGKFLGMNE